MSTLALIVSGALVTVAITLVVLLGLPAAFFTRDKPPSFVRDVLRPLGGLALTLCGLALVMVVPLPALVLLGAGSLLLILGGGHVFERDILERSNLLGIINRLRARLHRPPLRLH